MTFVLLNENVDNSLDSDEVHSLPCCLQSHGIRTIRIACT